MDPTLYWHRIRYLEFSGGGSAALSAISAWQEVCRVYPSASKNIVGISGCSAGSLVAVMLAINHLDAKSCLADTRLIDWSKFIPCFSTLEELARRGGIIESGIALDVLGNVIAQRLGTPDATLGQMYNKCKLWVRLRVGNLSTGLAEYIDHIRYPDMPVYRAIWASCALPLVCQPVMQSNPFSLFVDGGILLNYSRSAFKSEHITHGFCTTNETYRRSVLEQFDKDRLRNIVHSKNVYHTMSVMFLAMSCACLGGSGEQDEQTTMLIGNCNVINDVLTMHSKNPMTEECERSGTESQRRWFERQMCLNVMAVLMAEHIF